MTWWEKQREVAQAVLDHPQVFVKASHGVGKTHLSGGLVNWHFDSFDPSITLTTAPTAPQVYDLTWKEVRLQRRGRDMLPKSPRIEAYFPGGEVNPGHLATGYTAANADAFQGRHDEHLLVIFEEATGIDEEFWEAAEGMLSSGPDNRWLVILNPTDPSSVARKQELTGRWKVITISALDHPNIAAQLRGLSKPFPKAIDLSWVEERIRKWCNPVEAKDRKADDFAWPPLDFCRERGIEPRWYKPGPLFEGRVLGRWPSQGVNGVWSEAAWMMAESIILPDAGPLQIGCDVARYGDDDTVFHVRRGGVSLHHEAKHGLNTVEITGRCKQLAHEWGGKCGVNPRRVPVAVDDVGVGGGVTDQGQADGYLFVGINVGCEAPDPTEYPNLRSALWFGVAEAANSGQLSLARLKPDDRMNLKAELLSPTYGIDARGRRVVEAKDKTKQRLGRSPDNADAFNLAYCGVWSVGEERLVQRVRVA